MRKKRIKKTDYRLSQRGEAARLECKKWWERFTESELQKLADGDKAMTERAYALGYERIEKLSRQVGIYTKDEIAYLKENGFVFSRSGKVIRYDNERTVSPT